MDPRVEEMKALYREGNSLRSVAAHFGLSAERVRQLFRDNGIETRSREEAGELRRKAQQERVRKSGEEKRLQRRPASEWIEKKYSDEELLEILCETSEALGGILTSSAYDDYAESRSFPDGRPWPTKQTHILRFDTWRKALQAAGLSANPSSPMAGQRLFERGHCIDAIRHAHRELGMVPTVSAYEAIAGASNGALPSSATIRNRCGSWSKAVQMAGFA